jgi:hypothetical protein
MDKAREAVEKSKGYKRAMQQLAAQQPQSDLQPRDGYVTPMHRMGVVPATDFSFRNQPDCTNTTVCPASPENLPCPPYC